MGRSLLLLLSFLLLLGAIPSTGFAENVVPTDRVTTKVNVRKTNESDSPIVGALRPGDSAQYLEEEPGRYRIKLSNGTEGYVSKGWTRLVAAGAAAAGGGQLRFTFIDVGQGDSTLIECPNGRHILVDAGSTTDPQEEEIRAYLLDRLGEDQPVIDTLVITHPDKDHYNLIPDLLEDIEIGHLYRVGAVKDYTSKDFKTWLNAFPKEKTTVLKVDDVDTEETPNADITCGAAKIWVLAASVKATKSASNAKSIVLMIRYGEFEAILTGDATFDTEKAILSRYEASWLDVDLLKLGHHGSRATSTSQQWVDTLKPEYAVVSAGYENSYGHPQQEVINRVAGATIDAPGHAMRTVSGTKGSYKYHDDPDYKEAIYATNVDGNIVVTTSGHSNDIDIETFGFGD